MRGADNKGDEIDAEFLARMGRADPTLLYPLTPQSERVQVALSVVRSREQLVRIRTRVLNHVRGVVKTHGAPSKHEDGYAIAHVELEVDGQPLALDDNDPWVLVGTSLPGPSTRW